jgi:hypothetical protein
MGVKEILDFVRPLLPKPLRWPFVAGVTFLVAVALSIMELRDMSFFAEVRDCYFATAAAVVEAWWFITCIVKWKEMSRPWRWSSTLATVLACCLLLSYSWKRWHFKYNAVGFYESRWWVERNDPTPGRSLWEWRLEAVSDFSKANVIVQIVPTGACPATAIDSFYPIRNPRLTHYPHASDASPREFPNTRWRLTDFRQSDSFGFLLELSGPGMKDVRKCTETSMSLEER